MKSPRFRAGGFLCPFVRGRFVRVPAVRAMRRGFLWAFVRGGVSAALPLPCRRSPHLQCAGSAAAAYGKFLRYGKNSS